MLMLMGKGENGRCVFPLTSLQIGDLQSYLSHLSLFLAPESKKFYILVDNRPWLKDLVSGPAHLWQLMVTKSRLSPFANTRRRKEKKEASKVTDFKASPKSSTSKSNKFKRWFSLFDAATLSRKRALLPVKKLRNSLILNSKLHRTLYGFIVFEVAWNDVRGLNYLNELQTDTSLALEVKFMNRWEFDSIAQAAQFISSWFSGTCNEQNLLTEFLDCMIGSVGEVFYDVQESFPTGSYKDDENIPSDASHGRNESPCYRNNSFSVDLASMECRGIEPHTPPPCDGPWKRRKVMKCTDTEAGIDVYSKEAYGETVGSPTHFQESDASNYEVVGGATQYQDVLLLFRFNDRDLPFELKKIIVSNLRLLTLLEAGLPSWVIFLQSYPGFCRLYRPWMCLLARALYVLISIVTVVIGFYDLYKNVPLLTATASHLFGPLFDWIETWEMVSRIKYLGTMLFLHNFQKAVKWFLTTTRTIQSFLSFLTQPMAGPFVEFLDVLLPIWNMCIEIAESFFSLFFMVIEFSCSLVGSLVEILLLPLWCILSGIWSVATSFIYPLFWILGEILYAPIRLILGLYSLLVSSCSCLYVLIKDMWLVVSGIFQFGSGLKSTVTSTEVSMWRSLWSDLFSQIFRAVRSILNGFVAFFAACNRHRLSIYNHSLEFARRVHRPGKGLGSSDSEPTKGLGSPGISLEGQISGAWTLEGEETHQVKNRKIS